MTSVRISSSAAGPLLSLVALMALLLANPYMAGQAAEAAPVANLELPDAPGWTITQSSSARTTDPPAATNPSSTTNSSQNQKVASVHRIRINANEIAPKLTVKQQVGLGVENAFTPFSIVGWIGAAGWSHLTNGLPHYGTDSGAFGQRLGAAALRGSTESIFSNAVMAPILHEDIRYYRMGRSSGNGFFKRGLYSASRVFVTRTLDGKSTPNFSLFAGNLGGSILTKTYYPSGDTSASAVAETFGGSLAGSAIGFLVNEFLPDALSITRLRKP